MIPPGQQTRIEGRLADGRPVRLRISGDRISSIEETEPTPDQPTILPGLVDLQVNGFAGADVNADDVSVATVVELTRSLCRRGVTSYCPTIITASQEKILSALDVIAAARASDPLVADVVVGVHVEGPYLADADGPRGAHDRRHVRDPDPRELTQWLDVAPGLVRLVTLAPERPGATRYVRAATEAGIVVGLGHTAATPEQVRAAVHAGARLSTHLGNGSHAVLPRHPNHLWAQLAEEALTASFIADGHHLPADTFTAMVRAKGVERSVMVSDSAALAGCPPGEYHTPVGGSVTVDADGRLSLTGTDLLAGSGRSLFDCVRWALRQTSFGLAEVWSMASTVPARLLGSAERGVVAVGARADLVLVRGPDGPPRQAEPRLLATVVGGVAVHAGNSPSAECARAAG
ncbi:N-acetylglucosamine-6-phosphate deacetylase [Micromonospora sp. NPDC049460]|uniref:N-acetylglucosamine-6-phosphate deacetylase n=1 Tax=Micromonospora sp. NPDC049460 TaxID=3364272 RepID=UPI0037A75448